MIAVAASAARRIGLRELDSIVAGVLALDLVLETILAAGVHASGRLATVLFAVPFAASIAARRRWPAVALVTCTGIALAQQLLHGQLFTTLPSESAELAPILCAYGAGAWLAPRKGAAATAAATVFMYAVGVVASDVQHARAAVGLELLAFLVVGPWVIGVMVRQRNRRAAAFTALEAQAAAERSERERAAIVQERIVIGRELQDIIAHSVSVMVVQAGGARRLLVREPERARESILTVEHTGREALAEMRRLLGLLRKEDDPRALTPQPGLDQLPELVASLGDGGFTVALREEGDRLDLSPGIDLVAYRVIEAILRAATGGGGAAAVATIQYAPHALKLEVTGAGSAGDLQTAARAVSERVELYDGRLELVELPLDRFEVRCSLPLERAIVV